jgi:predicted TIM-barrel fold metal-dependent hydrolase
MRIVDAHTHFFSRDFFRLLGREAAAKAGGEDPEGPLADFVRKTGVEMPDPSPRKHAERWLAELDRHGVEAAVSIASLPGEEDAVREAAAASKGRLIPFLVVDPTTPAGLEKGARAVSSGGYRGLLLFPALHRFDPAAPALDPLYEAAAAARAAVAVHCGLLEIKVRDLLGIRPAYDIRCASPLAVSAAAERHRGVSFIIPHFGAGLFRETLIAGAQSANIHVDTSSSNSWIRAEPGGLTLEAVYKQAIEVFGPRRILFGTDSSTFPRGWRAPVLEEASRALDAAGAAAADRARILGENLVEMLSR